MRQAKWTRRKPTKEGWYWLAEADYNTAPDIVYVREGVLTGVLGIEWSSGRRDAVKHMPGTSWLWLGPITPPQPPRRKKE